MRLASISIDLDSLKHYCRIHGLSESVLDPHAYSLVYSVAVERLLELLSPLRATATLFAVGEDLEEPGAKTALQNAQRQGCEIASHSYLHDYALTRRSDAEITHDLKLADAAIEAAVGKRPVGFRAPGYTLTPALLGAVRKLGYRYDSSAFPAAPYYLAKAAVMAGLRLAGRPSQAILDSPRVLAAPTSPYSPLPSDPYRDGGPRGLVELPISVTPVLRFPFIATFTSSLPKKLVRAGYRSLRSRGFVNFQLHAVDLLDAEDGIPEPLVRQQRDLLVPRAQKLERLREVFSWLSADFELLTLADVASRLV